MPRFRRTRFLGRTILTLSLALMMANCATTVSPESPDGSSLAQTTVQVGDAFVGQNIAARFQSTASPEQQALLDDDIVTTEEYRRAFDAFRQCVREAGTDLLDVRTESQTGQIRYNSHMVDSGRVESCYEQHFMFVDIVFQGSPAVKAQRDAQFFEIWSNEVYPCLEANGIFGSPPTLQNATIKIGSPEAQWFDQYLRLEQTGAC